VQVADLSGVHVIVDAGHGGVDPGSVVDGLWESSYVYDIACRIKAGFERHTRATVWVTRMDSDLQLRVPDRDRLVQDRDQYLLTRPQYSIQDAALGVHLRWYLSNDIILNRLGSNVSRSRRCFCRCMPIAAPERARRDDLRAVARPASEQLHRREADIQQYAEYRNHPTVRLGADFRARVEASSRHLASNLVASLARNGVALHDEGPVRDRVLRGRRTWVPAVIRYSAAQHSVLLECCNMANAGDRQKLVDRSWRERFALAVVEGMRRRSAHSPDQPGPQPPPGGVHRKCDQSPLWLQYEVTVVSRSLGALAQAAIPPQIVIQRILAKREGRADEVIPGVH
jgi:N-acetylmuramoyl-L-alanine amidase